MKLVKQSCKWAVKPPEDTLQLIERAGRVCYKSEDRITGESAAKFIEMLMKRGHESVIEHISASVHFITDRGVTHEMVRHRIASYSQESTRYCDYGHDKFGKQISVILPVWFYGVVCEVAPDQWDVIETFANEKEVKNYRRWKDAMEGCERIYMCMTEDGVPAQEARTVLPNSLKTEIVMSANMREWRHFFKLRTAKAAHPQMRELAIQALTLFKDAVPGLFMDLYDGLPAADCK